MLRNKRISLVYTLVIVLATCNVFLAGAKLTSKMDKMHPNEALMIRKLNRMLEMMDGEGNPITLTANEYRELVFDPPRNYTIFVLFYNDEHICDKCEMVLTAFNKVAKTFLRLNTKFDKDTNTWYMPVAAFFVTVKISDGYRNMMVDLDPALPNLYYFAPSASLKYNAFEQMDQLVPTYGIFQEGRIPWWIEQKSGIQIAFEGEPSIALSNLYYILAISIMVLFNVYHLGYWETLVNAIKHANYSYFISVIVVYFLSGQMYNYMNNRPMFGNRGLSLMSLVYPGSRQYGIESVIIMMMYLMMIYGIIQLIETRERQLAEGLRNSAVQQKIYAGLSCVYFGFMVIQFLFNLKTGDNLVNICGQFQYNFKECEFI